LQNSFSFLAWNVCGLFTKLSDPDFIDYVTSFDVCVLSETFTVPVFDFEIYFKDFIVLHSPAVKLSKMGRNSGGLVVLIRKSLSEFIQTVETKCENILCTKLSRNLFGCDKDVLFVGLYNHPVNSPFYDGKEYSCTLELLEKFLLSRLEAGLDEFLLIAGDFNSRIGDWSFDVQDDGENDYVHTFERISKDSVVNNFGKLLIQLCYMFEIVPLNGLVEQGFDKNFTFFSDRGNSTIDLYVCSVDFIPFLSCLNVGQRVESHHMPVLLGVRAVPVSHSDDSNQMHSSTKLKWDSSKTQLYLDFLLSNDGQQRLEDATNSIVENVERALGKFVNLILDAGQCMRRTVKSSARARPNNAWFDDECRKLKREANRALNKYMRTLKVADRILYTQKRSDYQTKIREKKNAHKQNLRDSLLENKNDSSSFWSIIRRARSHVSKRVSISIETWKNHFAVLLGQRATEREEGNAEDDLGGVARDESDDVFVFDLDCEITEGEVQYAIRKLKNGKAPGLDELSSEFLKVAEHTFVPFLTKLFNELFDKGLFPESWCQSAIIPLFKKGDINNPENYRGISLLSTVSKVFTSILNRRLYTWAEEEHKIREEQAGFRKQYSTIDHIYTVVSMIRKCLNGHRKKKLYVIFVDYLRAYDSVDRESLWKVLNKIKTSSKMLRMMQGIYKSVKSCVKWGNELSEFFDCPQGLKQGCVLSPLIFSLLINDVAEKVAINGKHGIQFLPGLQEVFLLLFADDISLVSTTPAGLQNQINNLEKASDVLGLTVNLSKTKVMIFRKGGHLSKAEKWFYKGKEIEVVNSYKYLGFTLTTKLSFEIALDEFTGRAKRKVVEIMKTMWRLECFDVSVFFKLFDAQVKPMLLYAAEIWGLSRYQVIESVHMFACKRLLNVSIKTPNTMVYGELGRYPLYIDSAIYAIRYWFKLQKMLLVRLPKQAYVMDKNGNYDVMFSWCAAVKNCLDMYGFSFVWLNGGVSDEKVFLKILKERMVDCFKQNWSSKLRDSERFSTYRTFKSLIQPEAYLNGITISKFRNVFIRFRLGVNELNVNRRYQNGSKLCPFCEQVENEVHFILVCPKYNDLREKFIYRFCTTPNLTSLSFLLQNENMYTTQSVAMYLFYALKERERLLENYHCPT
jgi:hypothetical protein